MHSLHKKAVMFTLGLAGLASLAAVSSVALTANNLAGLKGVSITPFGDFAIDPGEKLLMTAEGDYTSFTMPLRAEWYITKNENLGYFTADCDSQKTCTFQADQFGGDVSIKVIASGHEDEAVIHIRAPKPKKPIRNPFKDALPDWAGEPVVTLQERGIIQGYNDGRYGAGDLFTRGQLITVFYRTLLQLQMIRPLSNCKQVYKDVPSSHFAFEAACAFRSAGWTDGLSTLNPDQPVSRGETASILNRVIGPTLMTAQNLRLGKVLAAGQKFTDIPLSHIHFGDTAVVSAVGLMRGNPNGSFDPEGKLNRAQAATVFYRVMQKVEGSQIRNL